MTTAVRSQTLAYEQTLISIVRTLPPGRAAQLLDFARFLKAQALVEQLVVAENLAEVETDNEQWDVLLATDDAQNLLDKLADDALAEHRAGKTRPMTFTPQGRIVPG